MGGYAEATIEKGSYRDTAFQFADLEPRPGPLVVDGNRVAVEIALRMNGTTTAVADVFEVDADGIRRLAVYLGRRLAVYLGRRLAVYLGRRLAVYLGRRLDCSATCEAAVPTSCSSTTFPAGSSRNAWRSGPTSAGSVTSRPFDRSSSTTASRSST